MAKAGSRAARSFTVSLKSQVSSMSSSPARCLRSRLSGLVFCSSAPARSISACCRFFVPPTNRMMRVSLS
ncbi:hypothetical protein ACFFX0_33285 [Citricoccus parietis]|uniref:Uncharacterized protein n=1 Tax=Citricoccus parietis TaxID=592307 RepID=A0ABV5GA21_9MICC